MLSQKNVPPLSQLELTEKTSGNLRFICAEYKGKQYEVRVPLHIWKLVAEKDEHSDFHLKPYVQRLQAMIARGANSDINSR